MSTCSINMEVKVDDRYDVAVAGGGPSGCMAAAAAARAGAKTLLVESTCALGGMATNGLVPTWNALTDQEKFIHRGLCNELRSKLYDTPDGEVLNMENHFRLIDAEKCKRVFDEIVTGHGADVLFLSQIVDVVKDGKGGVEGVLLANKGGLSLLKAKTFVDCTGDGDLAVRAGAEFAKGDDDGDMQPVTLCFILSGINEDEKMEGAPEDWKEQVIDGDKYDLVKDDYFGGGTRLAKGTRVFNCGHLWSIDNTDPENLSKALIDGRRLVDQLHSALKEYFPRVFGESFVVCTAPLLGIRETRRIIGDYILTRADYDARRRFEDEISHNSFFIDIHPSLVNRARERRGEWSWRKEMDDSKYAPGEFHGIPYRCLTPRGVSNIIVAGRSISCDREANSAVRVMPPCLTMGEAAGAAAAMAAKETEPDFHKVDVNKLRDHLRGFGAFLPEL